MFQQTLKKLGVLKHSKTHLEPDMSLEQLISDFYKTVDEHIVGRTDDATVS